MGEVFGAGDANIEELRLGNKTGTSAGWQLGLGNTKIDTAIQNATTVVLTIAPKTSRDDQQVVVSFGELCRKAALLPLQARGEGCGPPAADCLRSPVPCRLQSRVCAQAPAATPAGGNGCSLPRARSSGQRPF